MIELNRIYNEDCMQTMAKMDDESVNCVVTSPPYWGLRDYGVDGQIGLEKTPQEYVNQMIVIFNEVKRVLKNDGTLWLNLGDSYNGSGKASSGGGTGEHSKIQKGNIGSLQVTEPTRVDNLKPKDLIGIPWKVAFALQGQGWYLRSDIIWSKPNPMPESVTDRPTKAHEYIFLMSKSAKYYYDADAIAEESKTLPHKPGWVSNVGDRNDRQLENESNQREWGNGKSNKRSVWTVTTKPYTEAHFATFPEDLIEPCILAGCPKDGVVYDPFMGAGTTAKVALRADRNFIGSELNKEYCEIANNRIYKLLNQTKLFT